MAWSKYKEVQYGTVFPGSNLTDFPLLVKIAADSDIASECGSGGGIKFTSADGMTDLAFGLYPSSDITTGDIIARVKASPITSGTTGNPIVRLYYSASESTSENKAGVMDGNYVLFMPLEEDPSGTPAQMFDWVSETNVGTSAGTMTSGDLVAGTVGNQLDFDGSDDAITATLPTNAIQSNNAFTLEGIYDIDGTDLEGMFQLSGNNIRGYADKRSGFAPDNYTFTIRAGLAPSQTVNLNGDIDESPHAIGYRFDGSVGSDIFKDGTLAATTSGSFTLPSTESAKTLTLSPNVFARMQGGIDEVRLSEVARSDDWLAYAYENDFNNSDTVTLGSEQGGGGGDEFNASASLTLSGISVSAAGTVVPPDFNVTADIVLSGVQIAAVAASEVPNYAVTADVILGGISISGVGTTAVPTYNASVSLILGGVQITAVGDVENFFSASADITLGSVSASVIGTVDNPGFEGTADLILGGTEVSAVGDTEVPNYNATVDITLGGIEVISVGTTDVPSYNATVDITVGGVEVASIAAFTSVVPTVTLNSLLCRTIETVDDVKEFITEFLEVIDNPSLMSVSDIEYLVTEGNFILDADLDGYGSTLNEKHLFVWLDLLLKYHKSNLGYTTRLSEIGFGSASPLTLTEADPFDLVTTLENRDYTVVIIDADAADDESNSSLDGCVNIKRTSTIGANPGDITTIGGVSKTTLGLFDGNGDTQYRFWQTLVNFHERGGGGRRCPNKFDAKCLFLVRATNTNKHVVNVENIIGARVETQTVQISGSPTGGTYKLISSNFGTTADIPYNATASEVQTALRALPDLSNVTVTSTGTTPNYKHTIQFHRITTVVNPAELTSSNSLTGGTPLIQHNTTQSGDAQVATLLWMGYPGEFPEIWCGNSVAGTDAVPTQCPDPNDIVTNGTDFIFKPGTASNKYRDNFHICNIWFHGKRETTDGDFIYAGGLFYFSNGQNCSVRRCELTDSQCIKPSDDNAAEYPDIVDFAYNVRSVLAPTYRLMYVRQDNFIFNSDYVKYGDINYWPSDAGATVDYITSGQVALDFGGGQEINNLRFTQNTVIGPYYRESCKFDNSIGAYIAYNDITHYYEEAIAGFSTDSMTIEFNRIGFIGNENLTLTPGRGIGVENSTNAIVRYNVIFSVEPLWTQSNGISVFSSGNSGTPQMVGHRIYGNLSYRVNFKVDSNRQVDGGGNPVVPDDVEIYNNLMCGMPEADKGTRNDALMIFEIGDNTDITYSGILDYSVSVHNNGFWRFADSTPTQITIEAGPHLRVYDSLSSSIPYEVDDTLDNWVDNVALLPKFLDANEAETNHDFRLATDSPYKDYFHADTPLQSQEKAWTPSYNPLTELCAVTPTPTTEFAYRSIYAALYGHFDVSI